MSLLSWFSKKSPTQASDLSQSSGLGHVDATIPMYPATKGHVRAAEPAPPASSASRKMERLERREKLYAVVRESMTSAGVLSSGYKFKVLSLDSRGQQYLVMMDLAAQYGGETSRLAEIESLIAHNAKSRFEILVSSVYWRVNEHVTAGVPKVQPLAAAAPAPAVPQAAPAQPKAKSRFDPIDADEVAAFKQALASAPQAPTKLVSPGEVIRSGKRNPAAATDFQETQIDMQHMLDEDDTGFQATQIDEQHMVLDDENLPLSGTQYGDLR